MTFEMADRFGFSPHHQIMKTRTTALGTAAALIASLLFTTWVQAQPLQRQTDVFVSGQEGYFGYRIPALETAPDGALLAFGDAGGSLRLLAVPVDAATAANPANQFSVAMTTPELLPIRGVAFSPDGKLVATVGDDNALRLFAVVALPANG
jgi:WD40 repeat protein